MVTRHAGQFDVYHAHVDIGFFIRRRQMLLTEETDRFAGVLFLLSMD